LKGKLFIIVGPSGSGKSSVLHKLKELRPDFLYPLSATTRPMREGEKDGDIYHFLTKEEFKKGIEKGEFLEWAIVHQDNYYGLIKEPIEKGLEEGKTIVREVDIQGFDSIRTKINPKNLVTIFITGPIIEELIERIVARAAISKDELQKRRESMYKEFKRARDCDYMVENHEGKLDETAQKVLKIIEQEINN
jgi:guanylate kinase